MLWPVSKLAAELGPGSLSATGGWIQWEGENSGIKPRSGRKEGEVGREGGVGEGEGRQTDRHSLIV